MQNEPVSIPVALGGLLSTGVALAAIFWPDKLTPEVTLAAIALGNAVIAFGVAVFARARVTPINDPHLVTGSNVMVTTPSGEPIMLQKLV